MAQKRIPVTFFDEEEVGGKGPGISGFGMTSKVSSSSTTRKASSFMVEGVEKKDEKKRVADALSWMHEEEDVKKETKQRKEDEEDEKKTKRKPPAMLFSLHDADEGRQTNGSERNGKERMEEKKVDEEDPLDAFMVGIAAEVVKENATAKQKIRRDDFEDEDDMESFLKQRKKQKQQSSSSSTTGGDDSDDDLSLPPPTSEVDYDSDDNPIPRKKEIEVIPALEHSKFTYRTFCKELYEEHSEIAALSEAQVTKLRKDMDIRVSGFDVPKPCLKFEHFGFDTILRKAIDKQGFEEPTPIQKQAVAAALSGRDIIGIAKTGSGKTAAFVWPMLVHVMDQEELLKGEGPIAIICAPTRELAHQIFVEAKKYGRGYEGLRIAAVYGGVSKVDQIKELRIGCDVVVCTPGRLIDMIKTKSVKLNFATMIILDEADRMFDMGFEPQIRSIVGQIRPDRQTTFKKRVETLARDILTDPIRIAVGGIGESNSDVRQLVHVLDSDQEKWPWLTQRLPELVSLGSVLIFVSMRNAAQELSDNLAKMGFQVAALHGDKVQQEREKIMFAYKNQNLPILVATDVAARGLDVKAVKTVVNYDSARSIDSHIHRIGRTGRAGALDGIAYSLVTRKEVNFAGELVQNLEGAGQAVPPALLEVANQNARFRGMRSRSLMNASRGGDRGGGRGDRGRGERGGRGGFGFVRGEAPHRAGWHSSESSSSSSGFSSNSTSLPSIGFRGKTQTRAGLGSTQSRSQSQSSQPENKKQKEEDMYDPLADFDDEPHEKKPISSASSSSSASTHPPSSSRMTFTKSSSPERKRL